ncbi:Lon protease family protein [Alicyclobacillus ferrooxydans]|uniref:Lon protease family protein n=1 Tax=Alicyclobacillus ferrooxydans TaxID=471514 RepID=UPI0006D588C4|nr:ATP-binding protein [Alicyclobacillus ferrooxydans]
MLLLLPEEEYKLRELSADELRVHTSTEELRFEDTSQLPGLSDTMVGQDRAVQALAFGLSIDAEGYNIFVVGPPGTGRTTYTASQVFEVARSKPVPNDWCYVYNFQAPDEPICLQFPPGQGVRFRSAMQRLVKDLEKALTQYFDSDAYAAESTQLMNQFNERAEKVWSLLEASAHELGLVLQRTATGMVTIPLDAEGRPIPSDEFAQLSNTARAAVRTRQQQLEQSFEEAMRQIKSIQKEASTAEEMLEEKTCAYAIEPLFDELRLQFQGEDVARYLQRVKEDVIANHALFHGDPEPTTPDAALLGAVPPDPRIRYQVNVMVDHTDSAGAPVIIEPNPTYFNLFGKVEYRGNRGVMVSDYTLIKPGALHRANGGYLIVQAIDLLSHPAAWTALKRALKNGEIRIDNPQEENMWMVSTGLRPQEIQLKVKVILIGTPDIYHLLYEYDDAMQKHFKVKVEFDAEMERSAAASRQYANFVASYTKAHELPPFTAGAVAEIIDFSARLAGNQRKLSTRFHPVIELVTEASYLAQQAGANTVTEQHVNSALSAKVHRADLIKEKVLEMILNGTIRVDTDGKRIGQINGLAVLASGNVSFGQPHRITARTYVGRRGVINVERETAMSGQIHDKGVLILSAYLAAEFGKRMPMAVSGTIVFEQTYSKIDGDSASSTELYALLSSLSELPILQGIAVTGSVDQFGEIQPIGGVNEKIEGYFYICKAKGLTGRQGVMIPRQNVTNLFLPEEVVDAVRNGQFHIWAVQSVEEGIELLTGFTALSVYVEIETNVVEMSRAAAYERRRV